MVFLLEENESEVGLIDGIDDCTLEGLELGIFEEGANDPVLEGPRLA